MPPTDELTKGDPIRSKPRLSANEKIISMNEHAAEMARYCDKERPKEKGGAEPKAAHAAQLVPLRKKDCRDGQRGGRRPDPAVQDEDLRRSQTVPVRCVNPAERRGGYRTDP